MHKILCRHFVPSNFADILVQSNFVDILFHINIIMDQLACFETAVFGIHRFCFSQADGHNVLGRFGDLNEMQGLGLKARLTNII
jgi:hypothetical protein